MSTDARTRLQVLLDVDRAHLARVVAVSIECAVLPDRRRLGQASTYVYVGSVDEDRSRVAIDAATATQHLGHAIDPQLGDVVAGAIIFHAGDVDVRPGHGDGRRDTPTTSVREHVGL